MRNREYQPCIGCELTLCDSDVEMFEEPFPIDACWERFDRRKETTLFSTQSARHTPTEEET